MEVATQHPDAEVLGIDVSPHMLPETPPDNMELQVDDLNGRFTFRSNHFDFVHSQMVAGGIHANRWRSYIRDIFRVLKPGGWCQMVEIYFNAQSDNGTLSRGKSPSLMNMKALLIMTMWIRPRLIAMVQAISGKSAAVQRPPSTVTTSQLDEKCRLY
ncbi:hypothetical protein F53441_856 [Fusarium austroafricanum]|uniref:Methyltransferase domain-containing protein n=1 Tax=Fusarium austroafricanum TaxID=2364996 RepID=A0A8H4KXJ3_9HYPO|nr:hypothetical protein F53441_856 [Fusarium austroafricanum]